jgi:hypothetical protein
MTVGIALTNGLDAVVMTDSRVSIHGRQSDSVNKMGEFSNQLYSGVVCGTGFGNLLEGIIKNIDTFTGDDLAEFVKCMNDSYIQTLVKRREFIVSEAKSEIYRKANLYLFDDATMVAIRKYLGMGFKGDELERYVRQEVASFKERFDKYVDQEIKSFEQSYDKDKNNNPTSFMVVGFDMKMGKIGLFNFSDSGVYDINSSHYELGSGADGANFYLESKLQGVDCKNLDVAGLAFFVVNAYHNATINHGVGGTPKIAIVSKKCTNVLDIERTRALTNISGAYLSEFNPEVLTPEYMDVLFDRVLTGIPDYAKWAKSVGLNEETFTTMYIPLSSWQERANNLRFKKEKE